MIVLPRHSRLSTASPQASVAFEAAVARFAAHKPRVGDAVNAALAADTKCLSALVFDGFMQVLLARRETRELARRRHGELLAAQAEVEPTATERALIEALGHAVEGRLLKAAARIEAGLEADPTDFLGVKLAHSLRFMAGDQAGMLAATAKVLPDWGEATPGFGYVLGCHAFSLGEAGRLAEAESTGRRAVELAPDDSWGLHAVAHVYEMRGMTRTGVSWLETARPVWSQCNNFGYHMAWHLALFHLEQGDIEAALAIYDAEVRPVSTDDFRDIANATSMLWRLEQHGLDVGPRWNELHAIAQRRADDMTLVFASLHHLLTFVACGDEVGAARIAHNLEKTSIAAHGDQAEIAAAVGAPLARALRMRNVRGDFSEIARRLPHVGGSHAQRDVFLRTLSLIAAEAGDSDALSAVLDQRGAQRAPDTISARSRALLTARAASSQKCVA